MKTEGLKQGKTHKSQFRGKVRTMRKINLVTLVLVIGSLALGVSAFAQEASKLEGTVYLRSGQTLSGVIRIAELGVVPGSGIGTLLGGGGAFTVEVDGEDQTVPASDLKMMEASWANLGTEQDPRWKIEQITLTVAQPLGQRPLKIVGKPTWLIHASEVSIEGQPAVHAFPLAGTDFSPDNFITKIVLGKEQLEVPAEEPAAPAEEAPPAVVEAPAIVIGPPEEISLPPPLVATVEGIAIPAEAVSFTITCPECGKKIRITIKTEVAEQ